MLADRVLRRRDQLLGQLEADEVAAVITQLREPLRTRAGEGLGGGIFGQEAGGELAVEAST